MSFDQVSLWCLIGTAPWDPLEVRPILAAFVQADPHDRESRLALAEAYGSLGQYEDVEAVVKHLPATDPGARAILARIAFDRGDAAAVESLWRTARMTTRSSSFTAVSLLFSTGISPRPLATSAGGRPATPMIAPGYTCSAMRSSNPGILLRDNVIYKAARDHEILYKLLDRASTEDGRKSLSLLKELGAAYQRVGLIPEAKAWYKLALARDPIDSGVQVALYHLRRDQRQTDKGRVNALPASEDCSVSPSG